MEEQDHELIERYYRNALNEAELAEFRRRLTGDTAFREAAQLHEDALAAIRLEGTAMLRARLAAKGRELDAGTDKPGSRLLWRVIGLVAVLLGAWAVWWWMPSENPPAPAPVIENRDIATAPATDTVPAVSTPEKQSEPAQKKPDHQRVFAAWFQPYKDPSLEPARRGDAGQSPSERFQQLYWDGDYRAALVAFDSLGVSAKNNDNLLFIKANCVLAVGRSQEAIALLEGIAQRGRSRYAAEIPWYLALAHVHAGQNAEAHKLLRQLAGDASSAHKADARQLLEALN